METIIKKTVSIEFEGKKHVISDDVTVGTLLTNLGFSEDTPVKMMLTKDGFLLVPQVEKN